MIIDGEKRSSESKHVLMHVAPIHTINPLPVGADPTSSKGSTTNASSVGSDSDSESRTSPSISAAYAMQGNAAGSRKGFFVVGIGRAAAGSMRAPPRAALRALLGAIKDRDVNLKEF
jgi:hypothetical protein